jgi:DNA-directed RNA polymerase subunit RPC12/RpoP
MSHTKYTQVDVWWCAHCDLEFLRPSVPHKSHCPKCGEKICWWRRFATPEDLRKKSLQE